MASNTKVFVKEESFRNDSWAIETAFAVGAVFRVWGLVTISFKVGRGEIFSVLSLFFYLFLFCFVY